MPMVATLYHYGDGTAPPFKALTLHKARHYFIEPIPLGCSGNVPQARDVTLPGEFTTIDAVESTIVASTSIARTGDIDLG